MASYEVLVILAGLIVGWIRNGSLWSLTNLKLKYIWVLPVAYLLQHLSIDYMHGIAYEISIVVSYVALIAFCWINYRVPGVLWAGAGTFANFLIMLVNGLRMPAYYLAAEGLSPRTLALLTAGKLGKSIAMSSHTHLNFLGDIFPFKIWPQSLVSVGDILFGIGITIIIQYGMTRLKGEPSLAENHDQATATITH